MTLVCSSQSTFDQFHLLRDGENLGGPHTGGRGRCGALQAEFPLGPGTPAHSGGVLQVLRHLHAISLLVVRLQ